MLYIERGLFRTTINFFSKIGKVVNVIWSQAKKKSAYAMYVSGYESGRFFFLARNLQKWRYKN